MFVVFGASLVRNRCFAHSHSVRESISTCVLSRPRDLQLRFIWWSAPQVQEFMTRGASARLAASQSPSPECVLLPPLAAASGKKGLCLRAPATKTQSNLTRLSQRNGEASALTESAFIQTSCFRVNGTV